MKAMASARHLLRQGRVVAALAGTVWRSALRHLDPGPPPDARAGHGLVVPGPEVSAVVPPRDPSLVADYLRHVGGDPRAYDGRVPPHLFPQWAFPALAQTLWPLPHPLLEIVNGGCRLQVTGVLPAGVPLQVRARLHDVDDDGHRTVLHQRVVTGPASSPDAVTADVFAVVRNRPNGASSAATREARPSKDKPRVPAGARELARWRLPAGAGWDFATLTGDFNPAHWSRRYARAVGFGGAILHGFATMARTIEGLNRGLFAGAVDRIRVVDVRFTRPLRLPAQVGLYLAGDGSVFVGDAPGGPAYLVGTFTPCETRA